MLAQALCRGYHLPSGTANCAIKLDISKAFDTLNWSFLFSTMERMGFPSQFLNWIRACVTSCMFSVKINGSLEGFFQGKSGIRQGDPLSPYLFVIAMEVLTACIKHETNIPEFKYHWGTKGVDLTHLTFADDVLLFCKGENPSINALMNGVKMFESCSGLSRNPSKCSIFFGNVSREIIDAALLHTGFLEGKLPIKYLGLPLISGKLKAQDCSLLVQKLCARIEKWTCRFLSIAGRLQLLKSVLFAIQGFWAMYLFLPQGVLKKIQSYLTNFLWSGSILYAANHKVSWEACCLPIQEGGLGIRNVVTWNAAAILFQLWRVIHPTNNSVWLQWLHKVMLRKKGFWTMSIPKNCSWCVRKILKARVVARRFIRYEVGINSEMLLWHDLWLNNEPLFHRFKTIFQEVNSTSLTKVGMFMVGNTWNTHPSNHVLAIELRQMLLGAHICNSDMIYWDGQKTASISRIWDSIRLSAAAPPWINAVWSKWSIKKCSIFLWLAFKDRLLTKDRLTKFGMRVDPLCLLCSRENESVEHLFGSCTFSTVIRANSPAPLNPSWANFLQGRFLLTDASKALEKMTFLYLAIFIHVVWIERNARLHGAPPKNANMLLIDIKRTVREKLFTCPSFQKAIQRDRSLLIHLY